MSVLMGASFSGSSEASRARATERLQAALDKAEAQPPPVAAAALLDAMGRAHLAGVPPEDARMRAAAARVKAYEA